MSVSSMKLVGVEFHQSGGNRQFRKAQLHGVNRRSCYPQMNQAQKVKIIMSQSHLFRDSTIRLQIRHFLTVQEWFECRFGVSFEPSFWQTLSELWQTLYLLGVQTGAIGCSWARRT